MVDWKYSYKKSDLCNSGQSLVRIPPSSGVVGRGEPSGAVAGGLVVLGPGMVESRGGETPAVNTESLKKT